MTKITIDRSVLEQALEVLIDNREGVNRIETDRYMKTCYDPAIATLREALAQPPQEPVAEVETVWLDKSKATVIVMHGRFLQRGDKLYASPARKPLTVEQIKNCLDAADQMHCERDGDKEVFKARAIEAAAHGITA